jgi:hypothetical protein
MGAVERTAPPSTVRRELRREVGFCCPVEGCRSPYLTWHHFDPPWHMRQHHDAPGMVALCLQHHKEADAGAFTPEQLRAFKTIAARDRPIGRFNWKREQLILRAGGGVYVGCAVFLEMAGHQMIWLTAAGDGNQMLNMNVWGADGKLAFAMRDNSWTLLTELDDVEAPPSARSLVLRAPRQEVQISVKFTATTLATLLSSLRAQFAKPNLSLEREMAARERRILGELEKRGAPQHVTEARRSMPPVLTAPTAEWIDRVVGSIEAVVPAGPLVTCTLKGQLPAPFPVQITPSKIRLPRNNQIIGGVMLGGGTAISLN